jgi:hypothetical protein
MSVAPFGISATASAAETVFIAKPMRLEGFCSAMDKTIFDLNQTDASQESALCV